MISLSLRSGLKLDGSLRKATMDFLQKLSEDPTQPSLHVETINGAVDKRVRTARVNHQFRAVLFELKSEHTHHFMLVDVFSHDEGTEAARRFDPARLRLGVNPISGVTELIEETAPAAGVDARATAAAGAEAGAAGSSGQDSRRKADEAAEKARQLADEQTHGITVTVPQATTPPPRTELEARGYAPEDVHAELGIDHALAQRLYALDNESELDGLLEGRPTWESEAVYSLVAGYSFAEVRESLGLDKARPAVAGNDADADAGAVRKDADDALVLAGLQKDAAKLDFAYLEEVDTDSLRTVIEAGDFDQWRVFIHPEQRRMAQANFSGSARVFGGAGTGKTVVAVHRANNLVTRFGSVSELSADSPRVLLTTFTKGLAQGLKSQMNALNPRFPEAGSAGDPGLWVDNIDAIVRMVVDQGTEAEISEATRRVLGTASASVRPYQDREAVKVWEGVLLGADESLSSEIANETFLQQEYETVVLANQITTKKDYLKVARTGRGTPLGRAARKAVWKLLESVMHTQAMDGKLLWPTMSAVGAELLRVIYENGGGSKFDHVVVDEAQDFNAGHWRFLRACVAEGPNDIFLAEDSHQRIYGQPLTLSKFRISTRGRASHRLTLNYRTTRENLDYAVRILDGEREFVDSEGEKDSVFGYRSARSGPLPRVVHCQSAADEFVAAALFIGEWMAENPDARVGVMCRTRGQLSSIVSGLADHGIDAVQTRNAELASHQQVSVMTMHGAKGLEFTHVLLMGVGKSILPQRFRIQGLSEEDRAAALQQERSLLYVASSRARDALVITTHGEASALLPDDSRAAEHIAG